MLSPCLHIIAIALVFGHTAPSYPTTQHTYDFYPELLLPPAYLPSNPFSTNTDRMNEIVSKSQVYSYPALYKIVQELPIVTSR